MAKRKPIRNLYYDSFAEKYEFYYRMPYQSTAADFVNLHKLTTDSGRLSERLTLEVWARGVDHYSRKPDTVRHRIELMYPDASRLELFARPVESMYAPMDGWHVFGNEVESDIVLDKI